MIDDHQNFRAAELLINRYGENARIYAERQADGLLVAGNIDGAMVWRRILAAIGELQRGRHEDESLN